MFEIERTAMGNTVTWFEVATADPEGAGRFYGGLSGWTFARGDGSLDHRMTGCPGGDRPAGGLLDTKGDFPAHAVFQVRVADVEETCRQSEALRGEVVTRVPGELDGTDFAYLRDPSGNLFGIFHLGS
ncbi:VOC family protein [Nonomuraea sp. NPDC050691]|uniref:VOC family protein n=1 Tax=Nonomuraea sp. NPDC050691 TaxID=3155661 RepID=UPI003409C89D